MSVMFQLAVAGAHLTGLPLNHQLTELGAKLVRTVRTAPVYSEYRLPPLLLPCASGPQEGIGQPGHKPEGCFLIMSLSRIK